MDLREKVLKSSVFGSLKCASPKNWIDVDVALALFEEERRALEWLLASCREGKNAQLARAEKAEARVKELGGEKTGMELAYEGAAKLLQAAEARVKELREAANAYKDLLACYRLGKRPSEKLFNALERADSALGKEE